jgi:glycosyltransferase involved in cell wall biosynthesis
MSAAERRVAIVHDYLTQRGGAERVVLALARAFPEAPIHASLYDPAATFAEFQELDVRSLWLDRITPLRPRHRLAFPILPLAFATSTVDAGVVVCSSSGWAHGIRTSGRKVVYCHSPAKWLYRMEDYLGANPSTAARLALRMFSPSLRRVDQRSARSADVYLANSTFIASQIEAVYGVRAQVVFPPPGLTEGGPQAPVRRLDPGFVLVVARLLPYKHVGHVIDAFRQLDRERLVVVGDGPQRHDLEARAPDNVRILGDVDDASLRWLYANANALVAASREDFGLTPIEAASFGKPVAALRWGGFLDTVGPENGVFFDAPEPRAIAGSVSQVLAAEWNESAIRDHAAQFSEARFIAQMRELVESAEN